MSMHHLVQMLLFMLVRPYFFPVAMVKLPVILFKQKNPTYL